MGFRPISIRVVEEVDHAHARPELRRVWHARGDEVFLTRMVRPRLAADRQHEVTRDDDTPLRSVRVLGDDRVAGGLDENQGSGRSSKQPECDVANDFDSRTFDRVRLSSERANATNGGLNEVCISQVPNIKWSAPSFVFVPTTYAPYGIICKTFFFAFLSIVLPARAWRPRLIKFHLGSIGRREERIPPAGFEPAA